VAGSKQNNIDINGPQHASLGPRQKSNHQKLQQQHVQISPQLPNDPRPFTRQGLPMSSTIKAAAGSNQQYLIKKFHHYQNQMNLKIHLVECDILFLLQRTLMISKQNK
jgi:hypothetical protein